MPTQADIRRKNASFAKRAVEGKRTTKPAKKRHSTGAWVLAGLLFLLIGGGLIELLRLIFFK